MSKWEMVKLGDVVKLLNGRAYKQDELLKQGETPVLRVGNFFSNREWYYSDLKLDDNKYCNEGDLLYAWSASFGPKIWEGPKVIYHYHIWKIVLSERIEKKYLYFLLQSSTKKIMDQGRGIAMIHATKSGMEEMLVPLPPLETQKHIAKTLDTAAELLAMRKQQLVELDNLIKSTFYDMFGDPATNEKGWEVTTLDYCLSVTGGYAFKSNGFTDEGIPVIKIGNINSGIFQDKGVSFWKLDHKLEKFLVRPNDIVISLTGTVGKDDYANVCILPDKYPVYYLNQRNAKLELHENINVYFLLYLLKDAKIKGQLTGINRGIRQANISNTDVLGLKVPLPPLAFQTQFANIVTKIEEQKSLVKQAIDETQYLIDSLMSQYFE